MNNTELKSYKDRIAEKKENVRKLKKSKDINSIFVDIHEKEYIQNRKHKKDIFITVDAPNHHFSSTVKLSPSIIASTKYEEELNDFFINEYLNLPYTKQIESVKDVKKNIQQEDLDLFIALGLGNLDRVREYSSNSIQDILQSRYFDMFTTLEYYWFEFVAPFINDEIKEPKKEDKKAKEDNNQEG